MHTRRTTSPIDPGSHPCSRAQPAGWICSWRFCSCCCCLQAAFSCSVPPLPQLVPHDAFRAPRCCLAVRRVRVRCALQPLPLSLQPPSLAERAELRRFLSAELAVSADAPIIGDDPRAPVEVDEQLMCESCLAIVDHIMTDLKKKVRLALAPACA